MDNIIDKLSNLLTPQQRSTNIAGVDALADLLSVTSLESVKSQYEKIQEKVKSIITNSSYIEEKSADYPDLVNNYCLRFAEPAPKYSIPAGYTAEFTGAQMSRGKLTAKQKRETPPNPVILSSFIGPKMMVAGKFLRGTAPIGFIKKHNSGKFYIQIINEPVTGSLSKVTSYDIYSVELFQCKNKPLPPQIEFTPMEINPKPKRPDQKLYQPPQMSYSFGKTKRSVTLLKQINELNKLLKMLKTL
jgi:hypothetical protein